MYVVYSLLGGQCGFRYVGLSSDPQGRLAAHNAGRVRAMKAYAPFRMVILRHVDTLAEARRSEKYFKSGFGRRQVRRLLEKDNVETVCAEIEGAIRNPFKGD